MAKFAASSGVAGSNSSPAAWCTSTEWRHALARHLLHARQRTPNVHTGAGIQAMAAAVCVHALITFKFQHYRPVTAT